MLFKVPSGKRWEPLEVMTGCGAMSIREATRRLKMGVKAVYSDVPLLLNAGLLQKADMGQIEFPYGAIQVDFVLADT